MKGIDRWSDTKVERDGQIIKKGEIAVYMELRYKASVGSTLDLLNEWHSIIYRDLRTDRVSTLCLTCVCSFHTRSSLNKKSLQTRSSFGWGGFEHISVEAQSTIFILA